MDIRVSHDGRTFALSDLSPRTTVADLKRRLHSLTRVPVHLQQLAFAGDALADDARTLRSYHLHNDARPQLVLRSTPVAFAASSDGLTVTLPAERPAAAALHARLRTLDPLHGEMLHRVKRARPVLVLPSKEGRPKDAQPVAAGLLGHQLELQSFGMGADGPTLLVCGGVHGNETRGMDGVRALQELCRATALPLVREIVSRARVVTVPCLNRVGHLAGARGCPKLGATVAQCADGRVWVAPDERGGIKYAEGWSDPNRGWGETNQTVGLALLRELLGSQLTRPGLCVFNHDWALPQGMCYNVGSPPGLCAEGIAKIFARFYPARTGFGSAWAHAETPQAGDSDGEQVMTRALLEEAGVPSYTLETYCAGDEGRDVHVAATLFLLAKHAGVPWAERELVDAALAAAGQRPLAEDEWHRPERTVPDASESANPFQAALAARLARRSAPAAA